VRVLYLRTLAKRSLVDSARRDCRRNVPMAEEERSRRHLTLWRPVGVLDAMYVAVQVLGIMFGLVER